MSTKADFTADQWQLLLDVPPAVGTAVMHAERSGVGTLKESFAMFNSIMRADDRYQGNELIQALVDARLKHGEKSEVETLNSPYAGKEADEILEDALRRCREVAILLAEKAPPKEAEQYIDWAISIGEKVAAASKEGGFLGIGGQRVSQAEQQAIAAVTKALRAAAG